MCPFDYTAVAGSGKVGPINQVNHTSWVTEVTPTDRPKSVRNRYVIELFVALFVLSLCPLDISVGVGAFVLGLSQISSFFLYVSTHHAPFTFEMYIKGTRRHTAFGTSVCLTNTAGMGTVPCWDDGVIGNGMPFLAQTDIATSASLVRNFSNNEVLILKNHELHFVYLLGRKEMIQCSSCSNNSNAPFPLSRI